MMGKMDIINSTLGKALGGAAGGYTTGPKALIDLLRQRSRPYLFSNTLPPPIVATAIKAIDMIEKDTSLPGRVLENAKFFRREMQALGFKILGDNHPICPVMLGDARLASQFAEEMLKRGIYVIGFSFPVVREPDRIGSRRDANVVVVLGPERSCAYPCASVCSSFQS